MPSTGVAEGGGASGIAVDGVGDAGGGNDPAGGAVWESAAGFIAPAGPKGRWTCGVVKGGLWEWANTCSGETMHSPSRRLAERGGGRVVPVPRSGVRSRGLAVAPVGRAASGHWAPTSQAGAKLVASLGHEAPRCKTSERTNGIGGRGRKRGGGGREDAGEDGAG